MNPMKIQYIHGYTLMVKLFWTMNLRFLNEGQECETGPVRVWVQVGGRNMVNGQGEGGWYSQCTLSTCVKIEQGNSLKSFLIGMRENDGGGEPNQGTV
jgi:hypothetical protein